MPKRKREQRNGSLPSALKNGSKATKLDSKAESTIATTSSTDQSQVSQPTTDTISLQIVTGSYERVLHGFVATFATNSTSSQATFSDTFLFSAHSSSIRSLAISEPTTAGKRILATGAADERINLFQLSSSVSAPSDPATALSSSSLLGSSISENPRNRELGSLLHHSRTVTRLLFPTKTKLFSAAEDNTVAITRVRDWTMLSSVKAPVPKQPGRPSGDTASPGEVPAGVNDFALHPSMRLMISVGKGERCMRLWNLVTGKKAGVLNFDRALLAQAGEGKHGTGEGRRVVWGPDGERFVVVFERGAVVYNMDSEPVAVVRAVPTTKVHQARFVPVAGGAHVLAVSTENGRVMFLDLDKHSDLEFVTGDDDEDRLPLCACVAQIEAASFNSAGRVKDFDIFPMPEGSAFDLAFVTASSDGAVRIWAIDSKELVTKEVKQNATPKTIGTLLGVREVGNRLTCLTGFIMDDAVEDAEAEVEENGVPDDSDSDDSDDE